MTHSIHTARYAEFRRLLIEARRAAEVTQLELADRLGKPQSYVSKFEHGDRRLDVVEFLDIVESLEADPIELIRALLRVRGRVRKKS